jgi:pyrroloquinoline quinone (PQQ) biosynthesis protein C
MSATPDRPPLNDPTDAPWDRAEFERQLRDKGRTYHDKHPFHRAMNEGLLTPTQIRGWVANRFHFQRNIPVKDAAILSNCPDHEVRRGWVRRLLIHDGQRPREGGIEAWLRLGEAVGLAREELLDERLVVPGVRSAVESYVRLAPGGALAGRGRLVLNRALRPGPDGRTDPSLRAVLFLGARLGDGLFPSSSDPGPG